MDIDPTDFDSPEAFAHHLAQELRKVMGGRPDRTTLGTTQMTPEEWSLFKRLDRVIREGKEAADAAIRKKKEYDALREVAWNIVASRLGYADNDDAIAQGTGMEQDSEAGVITIKRDRDATGTLPITAQYSPVTADA